MEIYGISDLHIGLNDKATTFALDKFRECFKKPNSLVLIAGDIFHHANEREEYVVGFIKLLKECIEVGTKFVIIYGNHDKDYFNRTACSLDVVAEVFTPVDGKACYDDFEAMPDCCVVEKSAKIYLQDEDVFIGCLSYGFDNLRFPEFYKASKKILVCHDFIAPINTTKFDVVIKGHEHNPYVSNNVYSLGTLIPNKKGQGSTYLKITDDIEVVPIDSIKVVDVDIQTSENLEDFLSSLDNKTIAYITYYGDYSLISEDVIRDAYAKAMYLSINWSSQSPITIDDEQIEGDFPPLREYVETADIDEAVKSKIAYNISPLIT